MLFRSADKAGKFRSKTYSEVAGDVLQQYQDVAPEWLGGEGSDVDESPRERRGMASAKKPKTTADYPSMEEIEANTRYKRELKKRAESPSVPNYTTSPI